MWHDTRAKGSESWRNEMTRVFGGIHMAQSKEGAKKSVEILAKNYKKRFKKKKVNKAEVANEKKRKKEKELKERFIAEYNRWKQDQYRKRFEEEQRRRQEVELEKMKFINSIRSIFCCRHAIGHTMF